MGDVLGSNFLSGIAGAVNEALFNVTVCNNKNDRCAS